MDSGLSHNLSEHSARKGCGAWRGTTKLAPAKDLFFQCFSGFHHIALTSKWQVTTRGHLDGFIMFHQSFEVQTAACTNHWWCEAWLIEIQLEVGSFSAAAKRVWWVPGNSWSVGLCSCDLSLRLPCQVIWCTTFNFEALLPHIWTQRSPTSWLNLWWELVIAMISLQLVQGRSLIGWCWKASPSTGVPTI